MTSIGTLVCVHLVCAGVWIMRNGAPIFQRGFTVPALPMVSILGILVCGSMIYGLGWTNWLRLAVWLVIGLVFYFAYGINHSKLQTSGASAADSRRVNGEGRSPVPAARAGTCHRLSHFDPGRRNARLPLD
jgi:amino acid transporter